MVRPGVDGDPSLSERVRGHGTHNLLKKDTVPRLRGWTASLRQPIINTLLE